MGGPASTDTFAAAKICNLPRAHPVPLVSTMSGVGFQSIGLSLSFTCLGVLQEGSFHDCAIIAEDTILDIYLFNPDVYLLVLRYEGITYPVESSA
jgi:hypothetical protein